MSASYDGLTVVVTGASRGIGRTIAERFRDDGARVIGMARTDANAMPNDVEAMYGDLADEIALLDLCARLEGVGVDILINNAGINVIQPFAEIDIATFERIQRVNVHAPMVLCRALIPRMRNRGWGRIVNISSIWGNISKAGRAAYSSSKFAIDGLTAALAAEVAIDGILANCVSPGFIETDLTRETVGEAGMRDLAKRVPAGRLGQPEEVAALVAWLASMENTYVSGQNIVIDGGFVRV